MSYAFKDLDLLDWIVLADSRFWNAINAII